MADQTSARFAVISGCSGGVMLLIGSGLMLKSFNGSPMQSWFQSRSSADEWPSVNSFVHYQDPARQVAFLRGAATHRSLPGVGPAAHHQLAAFIHSPKHRFSIEGRRRKARSRPRDLHAGTPGYREALGVPIGGRADDRRGGHRPAPGVVVINQRSGRFFPNRSGWSSHDDSGVLRTVVGVCRRRQYQGRVSKPELRRTFHMRRVRLRHRSSCAPRLSPSSLIRRFAADSICRQRRGGHRIAPMTACCLNQLPSRASILF